MRIRIRIVKVGTVVWVLAHGATFTRNDLSARINAVAGRHTIALLRDNSRSWTSVAHSIDTGAGACEMREAREEESGCVCGGGERGEGRRRNA